MMRKNTTYIVFLIALFASPHPAGAARGADNDGGAHVSEEVLEIPEEDPYYNNPALKNLIAPPSTETPDSTKAEGDQESPVDATGDEKKDSSVRGKLSDKKNMSKAKATKTEKSLIKPPKSTKTTSKENKKLDEGDKEAITNTKESTSQGKNIRLKEREDVRSALGETEKNSAQKKEDEKWAKSRETLKGSPIKNKNTTEQGTTSDSKDKSPTKDNSHPEKSDDKTKAKLEVGKTAEEDEEEIEKKLQEQEDRENEEMNEFFNTITQ